MKLICKKLYFILISCVKIITINIFCATISLAINYNVKQEDLSSLFNQKHNNFKAFEDLGIIFYIYDIYYPNILKTSNNELVYDTSLLLKEPIKFNANAFKIINAGGGGDCFFHSIAKGLKLKQYDKDQAISPEYFNHRELRKILAQDYEAIAKREEIKILDEVATKIQSFVTKLDLDAVAENFITNLHHSDRDKAILRDLVKVISNYNSDEDINNTLDNLSTNNNREKIFQFFTQGLRDFSVLQNNQNNPSFQDKIYQDFLGLLKNEAEDHKIQNNDPLIYSQDFKNGTLYTPHYSRNIILLLEQQNVSYAYLYSDKKAISDNTDKHNDYRLLAYKKVEDKPLIFVYFNGTNHYTTLALYNEIMPKVTLNDIKLEDLKKRVSFSTIDLIQSDKRFVENLSQGLFEIMQKDSAFAKEFVEKTEKQRGLDEYFTQLFTDAKNTRSVKDDAFRFMHNKAINIVHNNIRSNNHLAAVSAGSDEGKLTNLWGQILIGRDYFIQDEIDYISNSAAVIGGIDFNINKNLLVGGFLSLNNFTVDNKSKAENNKNIIGGIYADFAFASDLSLSAVFGGSRIISKIQESENLLGYFADAKFKYKLKLANKIQLIPNLGYRLNKNCDFVDNFSYQSAKINSGTSHNLLLGLNLLMNNFKLGKVNISSEIHVVKDFEIYNSGRTVQKKLGAIFLPGIDANSEVKNTDAITIGGLLMANLGVFKINVGADWMFGEKYNGWLARLNMSLFI